MAGGKRYKGLRPVVRPECPQCGYKLRYYCQNRDWSIDMWVLTDESRKHLLEASCTPPAIATVVPISIVPEPIELEEAA